MLIDVFLQLPLREKFKRSCFIIFYSFHYSGKVGNWKDKITGDLNELFDTVFKEQMADSGLQFDFEV